MARRKISQARGVLVIWVIAIALLLFMFAPDTFASVNFKPITGPADFKNRVMAELTAAEKAGRLAGIDKNLIYAHYDFETGGGRNERGLVTLNATRNLGNRHKGLTWTGPTYFVSPSDPDLRVYPSLSAAIDDYIQLISQDGLYATAFQAGRMGSAWNYFSALKHPDANKPQIGYDTSDPNYDRDAYARYQQLKGEGVIA